MESAGEGWGKGRLRNPIGLAAGYDRSGALLPQIAAHGFGFVELGTVTPCPVADHNPGVEVLAANVERWRARAGSTRCLVGVNLGRHPGAPIEQAAQDFEQGMRAAWRCADYLAINLSGPANRALLETGRERVLRDVLRRVHNQRERLATVSGRHVPTVVKVPVVPGAAACPAAVRYCRELGFDGVVAALEDASRADVERVLKRLARTLGRMTLIAVGGIRTPEHARAYLAAGARLVQVYRLYAEAGPLAVAGLAARCMRI
jgi:dihydroorotate dehydrogenase